MAITDRHGRPIAIHIDSATPHEVTLVETTLAHRLVQKMPKRLIGDNAYESDQLDAELAQRTLANRFYGSTRSGRRAERTYLELHRLVLRARRGTAGYRIDHCTRRVPDG
jgi:hypothetical protein